MTVYAKHSRGFEEGVEVFAYDEPGLQWQVWDDQGAEWRCRSGLWTAAGVEDSRVLWWRELLAEFGPVSDEPPNPAACPPCGPSGCAGHTRKPSDVVAGGAR